MSKFDHDHEESEHGVAFRDIILGMLGGFLAILVILILLPHHPDTATDAVDVERERGNIRVEIFWPEDFNADVDLWGKAPGTSAVGYSNKNGIVLSLVRDDLGKYADLSNQNYEVMFSRGLPPGEWTFNIHWFGNAGNHVSIPVDALITITYDDSNTSKEKPTQVVHTKLVLSSVGQELTIVRFRLDAEGKLVEDSITNLFQPIRSLTSPP
jgi:hypothetical protein